MFSFCRDLLIKALVLCSLRSAKNSRLRATSLFPLELCSLATNGTQEWLIVGSKGTKNYSINQGENKNND